MKYQVIIDRDCDVLESRVGFLLSKGWKCQGGVAIAVEQSVEEVGSNGDYSTKVDNEVVFAQALVMS